MRTNIEIDDALMEAAMVATGATTKRQAVETALREIVRIRAQAKLREMRGIGWEGDLDKMRRDA